LVTDTPEGKTYARPRTVAALEVTSRRAVFGLAAMMVPLSVALVVIVLRISDAGVIALPATLVALLVISALLLYQEWSVLRVNRPALRGEQADDPYPFRSVAVLSLAYFCTFGSEIAAVSHLPQFFGETWGLGPGVAAVAAGAFAMMNLVSRPAGGLFSDVLGSRRRWLGVLLAGLALGFAAMSTLSSSWPLALALVLVVVTSLFAQAGNGAVYAIVPLVRPRAGGQVAGLVGAYGNVGGVLFLASLTVFDNRAFFALMAVAAVAALVACRWLVEPGGHRAATSDATTRAPAPSPAPVPAPQPVPA
jgi:NNP family nitrate/nitrite transporter-like MFS transporter